MKAKYAQAIRLGIRSGRNFPHGFDGTWFYANRSKKLHSLYLRARTRELSGVHGVDIRGERRVAP